MSGTMLYAQLEAVDCTAELWLNDVPLSRIADDPDRMKLENVAVDHWVVAGENVIELVVSPGATPSASRAPHDQRRVKRTARASARLLRVAVGAEEASRLGEVLAEASFVAPESGELQDAPWVSVARVPLSRPPSHGARPWSFETAERLTLDDSLVAEVDATLREVEACYAAGDAAKLYRVLDHTLRDVRRAFPAQTEAHLMESYAELMTRYAPSIPAALRDPAERDYRLVARGRLVECVDRDWIASVRLHDGTRNLAVPLQLWVGRPAKDSALRVLR